MSKTNGWENSLLLHLLQNANVANIGDATGIRGSTVAGSLYFSLHSADPGEAGDQTTNEVTYGSYARQAVARASGAGGFTVTGNQGSNTSDVTFPTGTSGVVAQNATYWGLGTAVSGAGVLLYRGQITTPSGGLYTGNGIQPVLSAGGATITED